MTTKFIKIDFDWELVKNCCRSTVKKSFTSGEPSDEFNWKESDLRCLV